MISTGTTFISANWHPFLSSHLGSTKWHSLGQWEFIWFPSKSCKIETLPAVGEVLIFAFFAIFCETSWTWEPSTAASRKESEAMDLVTQFGVSINLIDLVNESVQMAKLVLSSLLTDLYSCRKLGVSTHLHQWQESPCPSIRVSTAYSIYTLSMFCLVYVIAYCSVLWGAAYGFRFTVSKYVYFVYAPSILLDSLGREVISSTMYILTWRLFILFLVH